jgi:U3 small nucleolar RNA-associated protein 13
LVAITTDQNILFYNISSGLKRIKQIVGHNDEIIDLVYVGPTESHLAIATNTEQIRLFNIDSFDNNIIYGHKDIVICLAKSFDGKFLISGSKDNSARLWKIDVEAYEAEERIKGCGICVGHTEAIGAVALPNKSLKFCITGSQDRTVKYWDLSQAGKIKSCYSNFFELNIF